MTDAKHTTRPYEDRIAEIGEQIALAEQKRRRLCALWLASEAKKHDGLRARGRALRAMVDAGMWATVPGVVAEIVRKAKTREIVLPAVALAFLVDDEPAGE